MTHHSTPSTPTDRHTWLDDLNLVQSQDGADYFSQYDCISSRTQMPPMNPSPGNEKPLLEQVSSPNNNSAPPSPVPLPSSSPVATNSQQRNVSIAYLSLSATSSSSNVASIALNGPYSSSLLVNNVLENFPLDYERLPQTLQAFHPAEVIDHSGAQATPPLSLHSFDAQHAAIQGITGPASQGQWSTTAMHMPRGHNLVYPHPYHLESRSLSHWHPYSRYQSTTAQHSDLFEDYSMGQFSAPSSPTMSSSVSTIDSFTWPSASQHRRAMSADHPSLDEFDRRFSEGDLIGNLVPDFSMWLSLLSPESASPSSPCRSATSRPFSSPLDRHSDVHATSVTSPSSAQLSSSSVDASSGLTALEAYKCEYEGCTKSFSRPYNLNSHIRTHTNLRPYRCDHCERHFARLHDKTRHERLHRGVRPFACERCQHHFARMDALNRHLKVEGGRNLCNMYLIEKSSPNAMPIVDLPPKRINPLILAHFPNFGKSGVDDNGPAEQS